MLVESRILQMQAAVSQQKGKQAEEQELPFLKQVTLCNKLVHPNKQIPESPPFPSMRQMSQCWLIVL